MLKPKCLYLVGKASKITQLQIKLIPSVGWAGEEYVGGV